jgi:hypothetical protein
MWSMDAGGLSTIVVVVVMVVVKSTMGGGGGGAPHIGVANRKMGTPRPDAPNILTRNTFEHTHSRTRTQAKAV